jgi:RHS repeat-associated protein
MRTTYNGAVEGSYTSLPFGDGTTTTGTDNDAYHFAELDYDYPSATDHAQFRQYTPTQGRWLSPDPYSGSYDASNPQSMNRYAYVQNNPLSFIDPLGLQDCGVTIRQNYLRGDRIKDTTQGFPCNCDPSLGLSLVNGWTICGPPSAIGILQGQVQAKMGCTQGNCNGSTSGGNAPNESTICTPVFCPANDTPAPAPPDPKDTACKAQAQAAEAKFAKNPKTFTTGAGASRILSTLQGSRLPGGSPLTWLKWLGAGEAFYLTWAGNDAMNQAFYDSVYRDCMSH